MSRVYLLVEGQTEEAFVNELLAPAYAALELYLTPIVVRTSSSQRGGVVSYAKIKPQIERLCKPDAGVHVTTMFDLYALPGDFPGKQSRDYPRVSGLAKAEFLERKMTEDIGLRNFIPNLLVHEFEALLLVNIDAFKSWYSEQEIADLDTRCKKTLPEDINDGPQTAPSKRILAAMPNYQKILHGPLIAEQTGLAAIRKDCPHFNDWLNKIDALASGRRRPVQARAIRATIAP